MTIAIGVIEVLGLAGILFVGCAKSPRGTLDAGVLRGTVSYRERALPPDAVVVVRLSDVSRQDVAAPVIAETRVLSEGRQVPLPFELRYVPSRRRSIETKRALRFTRVARDRASDVVRF